ncbi:MAG: class II aldolase/adducin family protein [Bryobacterales bacterium]|nr:class II aldolase/adducin family protein [Bryobacterales bacterium]
MVPTAAVSNRALDAVRAYEDSYRHLPPDLQVRLDLAVAHRWAARWNWHEGVVNHFTALVPGHRDRFYAVPYGVHWSEVKARDFLVVDLDGRVLEGEGEIELTSLMIHGAMHRDLEQAHVVLHTHQPNITALTCLEDQRLEFCSQHSLRFPGRIAYLNSYGMATEASIGTLINEALRDKDILLMANHGVTVCGRTVHEAFDDLYMLDRACELQLKARPLHKRLRRIADEDITAMAAPALAKGIEEGEMHFRALRRMLWREEPDLAEV